MLRLTPTVRVATEQEGPQIRSLLQSCALPTADLLTARPDFLVACEGDSICGCGAIEPFGQSGLLRSLAVAPDRRGLGIGQTLVEHLERRAREQSLGSLVLLTQTARGFFERQGYRVIERDSAPIAVQSSEEFRSLCPDSACCMAKNL
jgi:amino-acid N-acetyltransferase